MVKTTYRAFHHWEQWLKQFLGRALLQIEENFLTDWSQKQRGKHSLLIGVPEQNFLFKKKIQSYHFHWLLTHFISYQKKIRMIEGDLHELPLMSGSIDLVILPHTLEFLNNPRQVLSEACRIVKPEGYILIMGFNPYSLWGLKKYMMKNQHIPWSGNFRPSKEIQQWLTLADFKLIEKHMLIYRPPINNEKIFNKLKFLEHVGKIFYRCFGSVYVLIAQAKVTPLTPIRMHWKQHLSNIPISTTLPGPNIPFTNKFNILKK